MRLEPAEDLHHRQTHIMVSIIYVTLLIVLSQMALFIPRKLILTGSLKPCLTKQMILMIFDTTPKIDVAWQVTEKRNHCRMSLTSSLIKGSEFCNSLR